MLHLKTNVQNNMINLKKKIFIKKQFIKKKSYRNFHKNVCACVLASILINLSELAQNKCFKNSFKRIYIYI